MAREGATGSLVEDVVSRGEQVKMSREASDNVQRIYEEKGVDGVLDIINEFKPITSRIAEKRKEAKKGYQKSPSSVRKPKDKRLKKIKDYYGDKPKGYPRKPKGSLK